MFTDPHQRSAEEARRPGRVLRRRGLARRRGRLAGKAEIRADPVRRQIDRYFCFAGILAEADEA